MVAKKDITKSRRTFDNLIDSQSHITTQKTTAGQQMITLVNSQKALRGTLKILENNVAKLSKNTLSRMTNRGRIKQENKKISDKKSQIENNKKAIKFLRSDWAKLSSQEHNIKTELDRGVESFVQKSLPSSATDLFQSPVQSTYAKAVSGLKSQVPQLSENIDSISRR